MPRTLNWMQLISITATAGTWGSAAGTALLVLYVCITGASGNFLLILLSPLIFMIGAAITVPVSVVAGVATIWPIRKWVEQTPILAIIPISIGGCLSLFALSRLLLGPAEADQVWVIALFGATTAISMVICVWRATCVLNEERAESLI